MKKILFILCFCVFSTQLFSQEKKEHPLYCVAFYNLENLFDTISGPNDKEYTPTGSKEWNTEKYYSGGEHGVNLFTEKGEEIKAWLELVKETYPAIEEEISLLLKEIGNSKGGFYDMRKILQDRKPSLLWRWSPLNKDFLPPSVF